MQLILRKIVVSIENKKGGIPFVFCVSASYSNFSLVLDQSGGRFTVVGRSKGAVLPT